MQKNEGGVGCFGFSLVVGVFRKRGGGGAGRGVSVQLSLYAK